MAADEKIEPSGGFSFMRPIERGIATVAEGYYAATYIPDDEDPLGVAVTEAVRHGPLFLLFRDIWICVSMFTLFPGVVTPFFSKDPRDEFYLGSWKNCLGLALLGFVSVFEVVLVIACVPLFMFLPGPVSVCIFIAGQVMIHLICYPIQGPSRVWSKPPTDPVEIEKHERNSAERWFFMNGCCVSGYNLQQNVDVLSETFGRPIFAIHNRTYGVLGDLFECIIQRSFNLFTEETRVCYEYIKAYLTDPDVKKVVLIAHSQGCIMAAQVLDNLYVDLPTEAISKLEIYTFGNAAAHFNNPLRKLQNASATIDARDSADHLFEASKKKGQQKVSEVVPERVIAHIEHYANSDDMVTRWGALYSAKQILENRFCGHIFINDEAKGHMLNQHYLSKCFPLPKPQVNGVTENGDHPTQAPFLDRIVKLDTATVTQRRQQAVHQLAIMRHESEPVSYDNNSHVAHEIGVHDMHETQSKLDHAKQHDDQELDLKLGEGKMLTSKDLSGAEGSRISVVHPYHAHVHQAMMSTGKTVRQLSRLWRYMDGADPDSRH